MRVKQFIKYMEYIVVLLLLILALIGAWVKVRPADNPAYFRISPIPDKEPLHNPCPISMCN